MSSAFRLRTSEPDVFHSMVKMHLSFLLDLNTDDCDCAFVMDPAVLPSQSAVSTPKVTGADREHTSLAKRLFTPKRLLSSGVQGATSSHGVMDGATLTMEGVCQVGSGAR